MPECPAIYSEQVLEPSFANGACAQQAPLRCAFMRACLLPIEDGPLHGCEGYGGLVRSDTQKVGGPAIISRSSTDTDGGSDQRDVRCCELSPSQMCVSGGHVVTASLMSADTAVYFLACPQDLTLSTPSCLFSGLVGHVCRDYSTLISPFKRW